MVQNDRTCTRQLPATKTKIQKWKHLEEKKIQRGSVCARERERERERERKRVRERENEGEKEQVRGTQEGSEIVGQRQRMW